jgi:methylmalonyl-CoA/ethylmalonyl-CoA epimerase
VSLELLDRKLIYSQIKSETKFLDKKGEGIHHIAFEVEDIEAEMQRLKAEGFSLLNEKPKPGADNKLVCFLHPKGTNSVLIELCMENKA